MAAGLRAEKCGFAKQAAEKMNAKYDANQAAKTLRWVFMLQPPSTIPQSMKEAVNKIPKDIRTVDMDAYYNYLFDGLVLGYIMCCLQPQTYSKFSATKTWQISNSQAFETARQRERIGTFLQFLTDFGVNNASQFQVDQLYEKTCMTQVVVALSELGMQAQSKSGYTGPKAYWP